MPPRSPLRNAAVVAGCMLAMFATAPGQTFVISTFNAPLAEHLELLPTSLAGAYLVGTLLSAACLTSIGRLGDRIGPRSMIALSSVGLALAGLALSRSVGLASVTTAFFLLRVTGQGALSLASSHAMALRFEANLGKLEGLRGATSSAAVAIVPQVSVARISSQGWRIAAVELAFGAALLGVIAAVILLDRDPPRRAPSDRPTSPDTASFTLAEARSTASFWILQAGIAVMAGVLTAVHFHLQPILAEADMTAIQAARTFASFAGAGLAATLVGGVLADRFRPGLILGTATCVLALGTTVLALAQGPTAAHVGMGLQGASHGVAMVTVAPTIARYFGRAHHGAIRGMSGAVGVAGSAAGPWLVSATGDRVGGFGPALGIFAVVTTGVAAASFTLQRPGLPAKPVR